MMDSQQQLGRHRQRDSRKKQMLSPNLTTYHRRRTKNQTPNQYWHMLGLGFLHTSRRNFHFPIDSLESRNLSSETSVLHGLTTWRRLHYVEDEDTVICHTRAHRTHQIATLILDAAFIANGYTNWKDVTRKKVGFSQHETWPVSPGRCREKASPFMPRPRMSASTYHQPTTRIKLTIENV